MQYSIQIPKPCYEPWDKMTPENNGRHCSQCRKTVIDFTNWPQEDILQYIQKQDIPDVCGRFKENQLTPPIDTDHFVTSIAYSPLPLLKKIAAIFLFAFGLVQMSCNTNTSNQQHVQGDTTAVLTATSQKDTEYIVSGAIAPQPNETSDVKKRNVFVMDKVACPTPLKHTHKAVTHSRDSMATDTYITGDIIVKPMDSTAK